MEKKRANNVTEHIGSTPLVKLNRIVPENYANIYAKVEYFNPGGSVKDRIALVMIEDAERRGVLKKGNTIIEPTSGNTGIGLAMVGAVKGYKVILVMSEDMSDERMSLLKSYGAEIKLTKTKLGMQGAIDRAEELIKRHQDYFMPQQFNNPANPEIHRRTTAKEILKAMGDDRIDVLVAGVGTGGTITGVGEILKTKNPDIKIVAVEPKTSAVLSGGKPGLHMIQGIGAGFIPKVLNLNIINEIVSISDEDAFNTAKILSGEEGLLVGFSSGAACLAALQVAKRLGSGKNVVVVFPDTGTRYFSFQKYFEGH
ncbi:MAG: cysteine synthase A [Nitrospinae bacterium RIFCSPLOWO2_02_FULL_39_110]|nr:MAG: cysteine synthase A [Nitrospinae bacterium RIFCSPHIGHO2_02_39_11]OGW00808.1 MAG: cysteine synthase A [Nitrospinae bacterium RIFCSPHIGHO2_12_FULL_39_42]OGW02642.1 MAG: cysteine synthase A [Nitrospinae bacterium RIFCSPLOWO2_02_39_17]OGW03163.1 MAG: cysteine synthase A [Nitrospinae bacterium RIFCSPHIGHO2_02_FULL_39_82]OGW03398.1 MAG: cysteine synthase A [Nitrospinae bacterium RIFCSPLOWO2_02_FULL_39_110]OGW08381.1 MAG: cysteine synthase A [Nitrospinae bacterium RIFCSPLOWO2_12_FULL_39_93]O